MKKRLIALMVAGLLATTALTSCSDSEDNVYKEIDINEKATLLGGYKSESGRIKDVYISVEQRDKLILHKGDIIYYSSQGSSSYCSTAIDLTRMQFDCGKDLISNFNYSLSHEMPEEDMYDEICEDCILD